MSIISIENLSNELFSQIFDYLDSIHIHQSFSNLNLRFEQLLISAYVRYKLYLYPKSNDFELHISICKKLMIHHHDQIDSVFVDNLSDDEDFLQFSPFISSFNHLKSLILNNVSSNTVIVVLKNLFYLPQLSSLIINIFNIKEKINDIYQLMFTLSKLKYCRISSSGDNHSIILPMAINNQVSSIEYFIIDHYCSLNELVLLMSYIPKIHHLFLCQININHLSIKILSPIILNNLESIYLNLCQTTFNQLEIFITKISSNLKSLSIISSDDMTFLDAHRWEDLILNYFYQLEKFYLIYNQYINYGQQFPTYIDLSNQFFSSFWLQRQWFVQVYIKYTNIKYTIRPYRKRWYDYMPNNIVHDSLQPFQFTQLIFESIIDIIFEKDILLKQIEHVLKIIQIYNLEILEKLSNIRLIKTMNLLQNLHTLKIHSISIEKQLTLNETFILRSIKKTSKITYVFIEEIHADQEEIELIFSICPQMKYLQIGSIKPMNIELFLSTICNIHQRKNSNLHSLCLNITTVADEIIEKIIEIIKCEKILPFITLKYMFNVLHLNWN